MAAPLQRPDAGSTRNRLIAVATVVVGVIFLRMTRAVTLPVVAGLMIAMMVWPVLRWLERFVPRALALLGTVLLVVAIFVGLAGLLGWSGAQVGEAIMERRDRLEELHRRAESAASQVGLSLPDLPAPGSGETSTTGGPAGPHPPAEQADAGARDASTDTGWQGGSSARADGVAVRIGRTLFSGVGGIALTIGFMALALAEVREARRRVRERFPAERAERLLGIVGEAASSVQRYLAAKSLTSAITGGATILVTLAFGLDLVYVWGLLAFLLEYVPTIGSVLAVIPPALYALIQFDGFARPVALTLTLTVVQLFLGNYVDPKIEGRMLALSPFVVLASITFWAWVWGAPGALLGVPLTIVVTTTTRHFDGSRWIWALLTRRDDDETGR